MGAIGGECCKANFPSKHRRLLTKVLNFVFSVSFFSFSIENEKKWKKYFVHFVGNLSRIPKLFFFHSSIKTEEVLFFIYIYIYLCIYIYLYIYKKLSPKWKNVHEQKVFFFFDLTYCVKISVRSDQ